MIKHRRRGLGVLAVGAAGVLAAAGAAWGPLSGTPAAAVTAAASAAVSGATRYTIDPVHAVALFRVRHGGVGYFWGRFNKGNGEFYIDEENPSASFFRATIDIDSVDTGNTKRDDHLKKADFFNARQFPTATFESTSFAATDEPGVYELKGNLTMVGQTRPITARVEYGGKGEFAGKKTQGFEAVFEIKRTDFGMSTYVAPDGGEGGGLGNTVRIVLGVEGQLAE